jgi:hypothetical protein
MGRINNDKWIAVIGCMGLFNPKNGYINIYPYVKTIKMQHGNTDAIAFMVASVDYKSVYLTPDGGVTVFRFMKKFVKIIK